MGSSPMSHAPLPIRASHLWCLSCLIEPHHFWEQVDYRPLSDGSSSMTTSRAGLLWSCCEPRHRTPPRVRRGDRSRFPAASRQPLHSFSHSLLPAQNGSYVTGFDFSHRSEVTRAQMARVVTVPRVLDATACAKLREVVDHHARSVPADMVGKTGDVWTGDRNVLEQLVGKEAVRELWRLPQAFHAAQLNEQEQGAGASAPPWRLAQLVEAEPQLVALFVRKYKPTDRPWFDMHADFARVTVNVALSDSAEMEGGKFIGCVDGAVHAIEDREEGHAIVHSTALLHGVSRVRRGERYALIAFFS